MGNKLRDKRKSKGLTQEELAKRSGISRGTICALENGAETNTTTNTLLKIVLALDSTVADIFFDETVQQVEQKE